MSVVAGNYAAKVFTVKSAKYGFFGQLNVLGHFISASFYWSSW